VNVVVAGLGTVPLAALMAVLQINSFSFMPAWALASAGAILVGQSIGAGARDEVPRVVRLTFVVTATWQCAVGLVYVLAPDVIFAVFARGPDPAIAEQLRAAGTRMLVLSAAWQFFDATAATLSECLRAAGDTTFTLWARIVIAWLLFAPGSWISVRVLGMGDVAAVGWIVAYIAVLAGVLYLRFRSGAWRRIELLEPA
jgi:MATE family multidrug resistance protein